MSPLIKLSAPFSGGATLIPNSFFDIYMPRANGSFVKIYLYLLRFFQAGRPVMSVPDLADTFDLTEGDVMRALMYWEKEGLLSISSDESGKITKICLGYAEEHSEFLQPPAPEAEGEVELCAETPPVEEDSSAFLGSAEGTEILLVIEQYLGRPLSHTDVEKVAYFHDSLGMSCELIDYLFEYCASIDKKDMRYIEKVAMGWFDQGIQTPAEAKTETELHQAGSYAIMTELGLRGRRPAPGELEYIRGWLKSFSMEMVLDACRRTVMTIHSPSFEYADSILRNWKKQGVKSLSEAEAADKLHEEKESARRKAQDRAKAPRKNNSFNNFSQRSYDYSDLEKKLVRRV